MSRTTETLVTELLEANGDEVEVTLTPFIDAANELVTECCSDSDTYTSTRLEIIETWLAAHFYKAANPGSAMEKAGSVSQTFRSQVDLGFNLTHYGQQAMRLDTEGGLAALDAASKKGTARTATATWLGSEDQTSDD